MYLGIAINVTTEYNTLRFEPESKIKDGGI
jgi:hypothetical protein